MTGDSSEDDDFWDARSFASNSSFASTPCSPGVLCH